MQIISPHLTEKTYKLAQELNVYVFKVNKDLNGVQIKELIKAEYKVEALKVRTLVMKGKKARSIRLQSHRKRVFGRRSDFKKALVTLKKGDSIPVFVDATTSDKTKKTN